MPSAQGSVPSAQYQVASIQIWHSALSISISTITIPTPYLLLGSLIGYLVVMWTNPVHRAMRDGWRIVRRYPALPLTLGIFGFGYALFQMAVRLYLARMAPDPDRPAIQWLSTWSLPRGALRAAVADSWAPALDSLAGLFNNVVTTFPVAALAGLLFLMNWRGYQGVLFRALGKRFGWRGGLAHAGIVLCAVAAFIKPVLYVAPVWVDPLLWLHWAPVVVWLAFLFEYLFGVGVQVTLLLLAYFWVRGISFRPDQLVPFAIRRFSCVMRWAAVVMVLSSVLIDAPLILRNFAPSGSWLPASAEEVDRLTGIGRAILAAVLLAFASVQITLTLHSESLRQAMRDHGRFLRRHGYAFAWYLLLAGMHLWALHAVRLAVTRGAGEGTWLSVACDLLFPWIAGLVSAWLLASWLCVYRRTSGGRNAAGVQF